MEIETRNENAFPLDFVYQVGPEPAATEWVLENLRNFYPASRIVMWVDGGFDAEPFQRIAEYHNQECCKILKQKYDIDNEKSVRCMVHDGYFRTKWTQDAENPDGRQLLWLVRMCQALERVLLSRWVMQLEDDVIIRGYIDEPVTTLAGYWCESDRMPKAMQDYIHKFQPTIRADKWGCCGGSLMKRGATIRAIKRFLRVEDYDHIAHLSDRSNDPVYKTNLCIHEDYLLTVAVLLSGGTFGPLAEYTSDAESDKAVYHGDKSRYVGGDNSYMGAK